MSNRINMRFFTFFQTLSQIFFAVIKTSGKAPVFYYLMKNMKLYAFQSVLFALFFACSLTAFCDTSDETLVKIGNEFIDKYPAFSPVYATWLGDHRFDSLLDEITPQARKSQLDFVRSILEKLEKIDPNSLSIQNRIDYEMLKHRLESDLFASLQLREWAWNPTVYTGITGSAIYNLMAREFASIEVRLNCVADRLEQFPQLLSQVRSTIEIEKVPQTHAETAVKQNRGVLSVINDMVKPNMDKLDAANRKRLEDAIQSATAEIDKHQIWLEKDVLPNAKGDFRIGEKLFDQKLFFSLGTKMTRREIKEKSLKEIAKTRSDMYEVSKVIYLKEHPLTNFLSEPSDEYRQAIIRSAIDIACRELPPRDKLVEFAEESLKKTTEFVQSKQIITLPPDPVDIILMPEFQRGFSVAYCDSPGALDVGQKTFYAISPIPDDWTDVQTRSFLREYNSYSIHDLTIHEAMPGHFVQLALASRYPGKLRAMLSSDTFIEGWAVYTERLMVDQGFMDNDPAMRLVQLKWYLRAVTNSVLDQGIHVDGMTRDEAMKLMVETGFQEEREAALKWTRAQLSSTQLSTYFVGYQEIAEIRKEYEKKAGNEFDLKSYHDRLLSFGSPAPIFARMLMLGE